jgi:CubicO group peptidase (beta-lactamase class C family)
MTALQQVVDTLEALPTTAFLVLDRDRVVLDHGATAAPSYLASARKSILSVLYGSAIADGTIRLGATLGELGIDDTGGLLPQERRATVRDLLTSSSGVYHPPSTVAGPEQYAPARGSQPPGALFHYNNWDFNALGTIFQQRTGRSVFDALAEDLAAPLDFDDFDPRLQRLLGRPDVSEHSHTTSSSPPATSGGSARCCYRAGDGTAGRWCPRPGWPRARRSRSIAAPACNSTTATPGGSHGSWDAALSWPSATSASTFSAYRPGW